MSGPQDTGLPTAPPTNAIILPGEDAAAILDKCLAIRRSLDDLLHEVDEDAVDHTIAVQLLSSVRAIEILLQAALAAPKASDDDARVPQ